MLQEIITDNLSTVLVFFVVTLGLRLFAQRPTDIPPGPWFTLPIIGNLFQVNTNPVKSFRELRKLYGDVFSVYFGNRLVIAINGFDTLTEAFVKNGNIFSDRPDLFVINLFSKRKGILGSSGKVWKEQRKLALKTLRHLGMGKNILAENIQMEITAFIEELTRRNGKAIDIRELLSSSTSNVISALVFGKRFEFGDPDFIKFLKIVDDTESTSPVLTYFPIFRFLPGDLFRFKRLERDVAVILKELVDPSLEEHMLHYDEDNIHDFISAYIKEMKRKEALGDTTTSIDRENLRITIWNLFIAGTETTATLIQWLLLYFLHFPEIQDRCFLEIQDHVGSDRSVCLKDRTALHYVNATIMETLRYADIVPLSAVHGVSKETTFKGFRIPKDAIVMPVIDSVLWDTKIWGDPENFRPERFLDRNGRLTKPEEHIPFLFGPRKCLGESLARMELFLFVATMIQKFKFVKPEGMMLPTLEGQIGFIQSPVSFEIRAILRK